MTTPTIKGQKFFSAFFEEGVIRTGVLGYTGEAPRDEIVQFLKDQSGADEVWLEGEATPVSVQTHIYGKVTQRNRLSGLDFNPN